MTSCASNEPPSNNSRHTSHPLWLRSPIPVIFPLLVSVYLHHPDLPAASRLLPRTYADSPTSQTSASAAGRMRHLDRTVDPMLIGRHRPSDGGCLYGCSYDC